MGEFFTRLIGQVREIFNKLDRTKKIIVGAVSGVVIVAFIVLFSVSSGTPNTVLFAELSSKDFGKVTKKLEEMGFYYTTSNTSVMVRPTEREVILTKLAQEDSIPRGIPGWKLFDMSKWTETDKELDVKFMRALRDEVKRHIESLKNIEKASVEIAISEDTIYSDKNVPYTSAVTVHLAPGYDKLNNKEIKGLTYLVSRAVGNRLKPENVTITDEYGKIISDFDDDFEKEKRQYTLIQYQRKIEEQKRISYLNDIKNGLGSIYGDERIQIVRLNMDFNWDKVEEQMKIYSPIVMRGQDPTKPYNTRKIKDSLVLSEKQTQEKFQGHGWNPEGPAGTEGNKPPGYKGADDQFAKYNKDENIRNYVINENQKKVIRDNYDVTKVSVAIAIDGIQHLPKLKDGSFDLDPTKKPVQISLTNDELKSVEDIIKKSINYNLARGDQVSVKNIMFDRTKYWDSLREEYRKREQMKKLLLAALIGVVALFIGFILFRTIQKEMERRRRLREEQLALEQQRMREAALRVAEEEGIDVELSLEDKARMELQENAVNLAKERPDEVAQLLRTWLAEE